MATPLFALSLRALGAEPFSGDSQEAVRANAGTGYSSDAEMDSGTGMPMVM